MMKKVSRRLLHLSRILRQNQTNSEYLLWRIIRNRSLQGFKFYRQKPMGPYIVDFCCMSKKLIIELDGGGHAENPQKQEDKERDLYFQKRGFRVLRYWNNQVFGEMENVVEDIFNALQ